MINEDYIIGEIRNGNNNVVKEIYDSYFSRISHLITKNSGDSDDAQDIFQDALVIFIEKLNNQDFELSATIYTYLYAICRNLWYSELRRRQKVVELVDTENFNSSDHTVEIDNQNEREDVLEADIINTIFSQLGELCQNLLTFFYLYRWSMEKIALQMKYASEQTARQQKYRCLMKARNLYSQLYPQEG